MNCIKCNKKLQKITTNYIEKMDKKTVIIENTPAYLCENCLEEFYRNDVIENIEKVAEKAEELPIKIVIAEYNRL